MFSASANGILVYKAGGSQEGYLIWFDHRGRRLGTVGESGACLTLSLSPDGTRAAVSRFGAYPALWLVDLSRSTSTRFTFGPSLALFGTWSPDSSQIIFVSNREGSYCLFQKSASGVRDEELLLKSGDLTYPLSWSHDGRFLLYAMLNPKTAKRDLWVLPLETEKTPFPLLSTEFNHRDGQFSLDGRWVAYTSDESGRDEVYVRTFSQESSAASDEGKWLISTGGGSEPLWRGDGKELYYMAPDRKLMAVEVATSTGFVAGVPKALFQAAEDFNVTLRMGCDAGGQTVSLPYASRAKRSAVHRGAELAIASITLGPTQPFAVMGTSELIPQTHPRSIRSESLPTGGKLSASPGSSSQHAANNLQLAFAAALGRRERCRRWIRVAWRFTFGGQIRSFQRRKGAIRVAASCRDRRASHSDR